jgi:hypothetical protein
MSERTFEILTADDIAALADTAWDDALEGLRVLSVPETASPALTGALPYAQAAKAYREHLEACTRCQENWLDPCPAGDRLSGLAADAMAAQDDLANQN